MNGTVLLALQVGAAPCTALSAHHVAAIEQLAERDTPRARAEALEARRRVPNCADAQLAYALVLGRELQSAGGLGALARSREYRAVLDRVLALDPSSRRARVERIEFHLYAPSIAGGSKTQARREIGELARHDSLEATRLLVALETRGGDDIAALAALERYADLAPGNPTVADLAQRLIRAGRYESAEQRLVALLVTANAEGARARAAAPYLRGRLRVLGGFAADEAVTLLREYVSSGVAAAFTGLPSEAAGRYRLGEALERTGACAAAHAEYEHARALDAKVDGLTEGLRRTRTCDPF